MKKILSILFALLWVISLNAQVLTVYKSGRGFTALPIPTA